MTPSEKKLKERNEFIDNLFKQKERQWKYVNLNGHDTKYLISSDGKLVGKKSCREMTPHINQRIL